MTICRVFRVMTFLACICGANSFVSADFPLLVRAENFIVPPSTGPITHLVVKNQKDTPYKCIIQIKYPKDWVLSPEQIDISLKAQETEKIPISIDKAIDLKSNWYPVEITVTSGDNRKVFKQNVFAATTPVFTPKIDANLKDWDPAVPITFETKGLKTIIKTAWNRNSFNVAVVVEEEKLSGYKNKGDGPTDAVQFAIAPRNTETPQDTDKPSQRYEFLIVDSSGFMATDKCFRLMQPGDNISVAKKNRNLAPLHFKEAKVAVKRIKNLTIYECSIPLSSIPKVKPMTGRDYLMSFLVHDPDGTGIRDLGKASGLWQLQRNKFAWSSSKGAKWQEKPPFDSKIEWGFCTTKY